MGKLVDINIQVKGAEQLSRDFAFMSKNGLENATRAAVRKTANVVRDALRTASPVLTGILKKSWISKVLGGWNVIGYVWVKDAVVKPSMSRGSALALYAKGKQKVMWKGKMVDATPAMLAYLSRPKNPWKYAAWAMEDCPKNSGLFSDTVDAVSPVLEESLAENMQLEFRKRGIALR